MIRNFLMEKENIEADNSDLKLPRVYICEVQGHDIEGNGSEKMPFQSLGKAVQTAKGVTEKLFMVRKDIKEGYAPAAKAALKKAAKNYEIALKKAQKSLEKSLSDTREAEEKQAATLKKLEESKSVVLTNDPSLPAPKVIKIKDGHAHRGLRVKVFGWVHRLRVQGKDMIFLVLRDGYGYLQCVLSGKLCHTYDALTLTSESSVAVYGVLQAVPDGKSAYDGHELICDYWEVLGKAPGGDDAFTNKLNAVFNY
jgi:asparaginyl-tRNA synthetase